MQVNSSQKQSVASNLIVHSSLCSIIERAIRHVGVVNKYAQKASLSTIVGNVVSEYGKTGNTKVQPYGGQ